MDMDTSDSSTTNDDKEECKLKCQYEMPHAIVYTTRLDEMNIFKDDPSRKCIDKIMNSIIKESKPKLLKRKLPQTEFHYSCEDLSFYIKEFNRKVARIAKQNNRLLSLCRPVRVVLEDIKYTLSTQGRLNKNSKISEPISVYNLPCKLNVKIIYDQQLKEADMYYLDEKNLLQGYNKFRIDDMFHSLEVDNNMFVISCCCWHNRDAYLNTLVINLNNTVRFMRKPHPCAVNRCVCCCRRKPILNLSDKTSTSSLNPSEPPSKFLKNNEKLLSLLSSDKSRNSQKILLQCSKSLTAVSKSKEKKGDHHPVIEDALPFLHSTNIDFGEEYYVIGADGQIILHLRNYKRGQNLPSLVSKTANNIVGDICCWYKREEFATRLLELHALPNTVNYIRGVHSCSPTFCTCCCRPSNIEKTEMTLLPKVAMHTNDLVSKLVNIKVKISGVVGKPVIPDDAKHDTPETIDLTEDTIYKMYSVEDTDKNAKDFVSFNVSLSAIDMLPRSNSESFPLIITENDPNSVQVLVDKTGKRSAVMKCTRPLHNFTTKELKILDLIFRAINNATKQENELKPTKVRVQKHYVLNTIYPLLLNTQICISSDLRNKRFMPALQNHLEKYKLDRIDHVSTWLAKEKENPIVKSKSNAKEKKL